jgi:hypothetical protein
MGSEHARGNQTGQSQLCAAVRGSKVNSTTENENDTPIPSIIIACLVGKPCINVDRLCDAVKERRLVVIHLYETKTVHSDHVVEGRKIKILSLSRLYRCRRRRMMMMIDIPF